MMCPQEGWANCKNYCEFDLHTESLVTRSGGVGLIIMFALLWCWRVKESSGVNYECYIICMVLLTGSRTTTTYTT